jgi:hypothetical protein
LIIEYEATPTRTTVAAIKVLLAESILKVGLGGFKKKEKKEL